MTSPRPAVAAGLVLLLFSGASASAAGAADASPAADGPSVAADPVYVDGATLLYRSTDPLQVDLLVSGNLPTPCHVAEWATTAADDVIAVELWSQQEGDGLCAAVLAPVTLAIPLDGAAAGRPVELDGEAVGAVVEPTDLGSIDGLAGAGWSFGMCAGVCITDLAVDGSALALRGYEHGAPAPVFTNRGDLTTGGAIAIDEAIAGIDAADLAAVYGCPDCADGGAGWVRLEREGAISQHTFELGDPPPALAGLVGHTDAVIAALESCRSNELVAVSIDCRPQER